MTEVRNSAAPTGSHGSFVQRIEPFPKTAFPDGIRSCFGKYEEPAFRDGLFCRYGVEMPRALKMAVAKRRAEFLAGRVCAQSCLRDLFSASTDVAIGEHRQPIWPTGVKGSISHSSGLVGALATDRSDVAGVGLDIEKLVSGKDAERLATHVMTESEWKFACSSNLPEPTCFTLAFSAKETFFKAVFGRIGFYFDFDTVRVDQIKTSRVMLSIRESLDGRLRVGAQVQVDAIELDDGFIATWLVLQRCQPIFT